MHVSTSFIYVLSTFFCIITVQLILYLLKNNYGCSVNIRSMKDARREFKRKKVLKLENLSSAAMRPM